MHHFRGAVRYMYGDVNLCSAANLLAAVSWSVNETSRLLILQ